MLPAVGRGGPVGVPGVLQVQRLGPGGDQPRVAAAQADELLVGAQDGRAPGREPGGVLRVGGADGVVPAEALLLDAGEALLVPVVDRGDAPHRHEDGQGGHGAGGADPGGDAGDVVVADEGLGGEGVQERVVAGQVPVELEEVGVGQGGPDRLPQLVLGERVHGGVLDDRGVVAVDDLAEEPRPRMVAAHGRQDPGPEVGRHRVGRVQAPAVDAAGEPVPHDVGGVVDGGPAGVVQARQVPVPLEHARARALRGPPVDVEQGGRLAVGPLVQGPAQEGVVGADVAEDAVEHEAQPALPAGGDEVVEVGVPSQARVDAQLVQGVVAVAGRGEDRAQQEAGGAQLDGVVQPVQQPAQPGRGGAVAVADGGSGEAQRVDVPPDGVLDPVHETS